jgi:Dolichyl-phosphate-mannose-protein mannosyltransferase
MNKILTLMTGLGLGAMLVYLSKKKSAPEFACDEVEEVIGASSSNLCKQANQKKVIDDSPSLQLVQSQCSDLGGLLIDRNELVNASSILSRCLSGYREAARIGRTLSKQPLGRKVLQCGRLVCRLINRVSFRISLCALGVRILLRIRAGKGRRSSAGINHTGCSKTDCPSVIGVMSLAFFLRLSVLRLQTPIGPDSVYYATLGKRLVSGNLEEGLSTFWPPLYPSLVGLSSLVFRDIETGGKFVSVLAGSVLVIPVYSLIRVLYGKDAAFIGAFLVAIHPTLIHYSTALLTESTYTTLFVTVLFAGLKAFWGGAYVAFFSVGLMLGACYLLKPESIGYVCLMAVLTSCTSLSGNHLPPSEVLFSVMALVAGASLLSLPYMLFLRRATGEWTISDKFRAHVYPSESWERRWHGLSEGRTTTLADRLYAGASRKDDSVENRESPAADASSLRMMTARSIEALRSEARLLIYGMTPPHFMLLMGLGMFKTEWWKELYLLSFFTLTLIGYALCPDEVNDRLLVPLLPVTICWVAGGLKAVEDWLVEFFKQTKISRAVPFINPATLRLLMITALVFSMLPWAIYALMAIPAAPMIEYEEAGRWVKERSETPALIMATAPFIAFYAGGCPVDLPAEKYQTVVEHARRLNVDYVAIDEALISNGVWGNNEYSDLRSLLDERNHHPGLSLVYKFDRMPGRKIFIYTLTSDL